MKNKQTRIQIGNNTNLFDWLYVDNGVKAHLLAADKLLDPPVDSITLDRSLPPITLTTGKYTIPTSVARPPGPAPEITPELEKLYFAFQEGIQNKTSIRSKFDPFTDDALELEPTYPLQVAGQAFFITNGEPLYIWDFFRAMWKELGHQNEKSVIKVPNALGLVLGSLSEWYSWLMGREPGFSRARIYYVTQHRWFNIEKARRVLGYEPEVGIEEGIKRTCAVRLVFSPGCRLSVRESCGSFRFSFFVVVDRRTGKATEGVGFGLLFIFVFARIVAAGFTAWNA